LSSLEDTEHFTPPILPNTVVIVEQFKIGDQVRLKSGGPVMTVALVGKAKVIPVVMVKWFDSKQEIRQDTFPVEAVEKLEE
jgi:uncharacterized protein YodC (DUF2158 family)